MHGLPDLVGDLLGGDTDAKGLLDLEPPVARAVLAHRGQMLTARMSSCSHSSSRASVNPPTKNLVAE
ncbi:hypothetical protein V525_14765 [Gordonia alkanivorans CGMCC 6845]|uniref:Uncharacterized protein n=1 Tax=Gordonia alkanivorans CGMCC 6845 TaxID=1423140 RepID=W9DCM6_9ACTN|nr:hypothetical protein V525_14765 [Gordonia alkanivorans CGMCC 6845]